MPQNPALDVYAAALTLGRVRVRDRSGHVERLDVDRWMGPATAADESVLRHALAPVLDVGCGPGRHVQALARRGALALGLDISPEAVRLARDRGAPAFAGSVFRRVPGAGEWRTVLLLDGSVGIGGAPDALLRRARELLARDGRVLVEVDAPGRPSVTTSARLEGPDGDSDWFAWARLGLDGAGGVAESCGLRLATSWCASDRWFVRLERA